ncbi:pilus assembly FimT family protein [Novosphingobium sp.]|uniref:pilus assembly FimT family protein n=1 Tax=Novosphingobium sp. TaxID=1874826 RepID=UPI003BAB355B
MSATGSLLPRRIDAGFTLFELLVAVAIMSLAAGIAFPELYRVNTRRTLDHAARAVAVAIVSARVEALTRGHVVQLGPDASATDVLLANGQIVARLPAGARVDWPARKPAYYPDGSARGDALAISAGTATRTVDPIAQP